MITIFFIYLYDTAILFVLLKNIRWHWLNDHHSAYQSSVSLLLVYLSKTSRSGYNPRILDNHHMKLTDSLFSVLKISLAMIDTTVPHMLSIVQNLCGDACFLKLVEVRNPPQIILAFVQNVLQKWYVHISTYAQSWPFLWYCIPRGNYKIRITLNKTFHNIHCPF